MSIDPYQSIPRWWLGAMASPLDPRVGKGKAPPATSSLGSEMANLWSTALVWLASLAAASTASATALVEHRRKKRRRKWQVGPLRVELTSKDEGTVWMSHKPRDVSTSSPCSDQNTVSEEQRKPKSGKLLSDLFLQTDVEVLVIDLQDVGSRFYTYIWTMYDCLVAAASMERSPTVMVLDRPNPINGDVVYLEEDSDPLRVALATIITIKEMYPASFQWQQSESRFWVDCLAGTSQIREAIDAGASVDELASFWQDDLVWFTAMRAKYLLY
eukprot:jgi/Pico_ML_1/54272/g4644.t2